MCVSLPPTRQTSEPALTLIGPCRPLCQRVKDSCLRILQNFNLEWPEALSCDKFPPTNNHSHMCMDGGSSRSKSSQGNNVSGGGASYSTFQSLQNYPELISKYKVITDKIRNNIWWSLFQDISKDNPEHAKFVPIIRLIENSVHNIKPAKVMITLNNLNDLQSDTPPGWLRQVLQCGFPGPPSLRQQDRRVCS